jgi:ComF family protein
MALSGIIVAAYYEEGPTKEIIHNFKYNHALGLKKVLEDLLVEAIKRSPRYARDDNFIISFTPLHHRRLAERGFNQAELLAQTVSKKLKIPCESLLIKIKSTKRQVGLTGDIRRKNLTGVFKLKNSIDVNKKQILIIDDITTTGTTLNECAKVLRAAGAKEVWGLVVARG